MKFRLAGAVLAALALTTATNAAVAQTPASPSPVAPPAGATLTLDADGVARAVPDMATVTVGVDATQPTAAGAMADAATRMARVIDALKKAGIAERDLQTSNLGLEPQYVYEPGQPPRLTGYKASNQLVVTVNDLARLGDIADAAVAAGATGVSQIAFGLANPRSTEDTARIAAVKALEDKASLYANAVGYRIVRLVNLSEGQPNFPAAPMALMSAGAKVGPRTPVEAGELTVHVDITGVFELAR